MRAFTLLVAALLAGPVLAQEPRSFTVAAGSTLTYKVVHKLHLVTGISKSIEGKARVLPGGMVQAMLRSGVANFDSGNANRDTHVKEATQAQRYPVVEFKGVAAGFSLPSTYPGEAHTTLNGQVTFHGVVLPVVVPVKVLFQDEGHAIAEATFPISLEAFGVERPALMFVKVDDAVTIEAQLILERSP